VTGGVGEVGYGGVEQGGVGWGWWDALVQHPVLSVTTWASKTDVYIFMLLLFIIVVLTIMSNLHSLK